MRPRGGGAMRRVITGLLVCVLFSAWASVPGSFAGNYGPQQTVIIARADLGSAVTLDPNLVYEVAGAIADHNMYSNLVTFVGGNLTQPRPQVARSWEVSQDARTYTFHLNRGIVFTSGNPLTADDVIYSFQRV